MSNAWRSSQFDSQEQEPLGPLANLIDIMLVFCCGLIAALVALSPELEQHFQVKQQSATKKESSVSKEPLANKESSTRIQPVDSVGKELTSTPEALKNRLQSQEGYQSMGQVYRDPETGKLILISNEKS
ncbi:DUF2149 domain-containing protein [Colwellia psychrerythraea]|uniref:DUF2149 domain-containing protein n=1 Tax=Colwellia psychrerythraea TaxID=28229 RepID=A0A099KAY4_COLPS|nr:DUF2149 domain-containing protein [Colwellia psychrerythraea]KGJ87207.1 Protein of unknown function DUF2149 [Colwellia psychrerythraea]